MISQLKREASGVRRPGAALAALPSLNTHEQYQSGAGPPHSRRFAPMKFAAVSSG
jgi:hypothetical protein